MKKLTSGLRKFIREKDPDGTQYHLHRLWKHWPEVVGEHYASIVHPIGHRNTTLILGVEDHFIMQEMAHYSPMLLEQANDFLGMKFFDKVRVELIGDHVSLDAIPGAVPGKQRLKPKKPERLGALLGKMDPNSPVAKCYKAYVEFFDQTEEDGKP